MGAASPHLRPLKLNDLSLAVDIRKFLSLSAHLSSDVAVHIVCGGMQASSVRLCGTVVICVKVGSHTYDCKHT